MLLLNLIKQMKYGLLIKLYIELANKYKYNAKIKRQYQVNSQNISYFNMLLDNLDYFYFKLLYKSK